MHSFPRDPNSGFDYIDSDAIRNAVLELAVGLNHVEGIALNRHFVAMAEQQGGWHVVEVLKLGAVCAFMKSLGPEDYSAALVREALAERGWECESRAPVPG